MLVDPEGCDVSSHEVVELGRIQKCAIGGSPCDSADGARISFSEPASELCFRESPLVEF